MLSALSSERPELIIVANWRDITARSLSLIRLPPRPGIFSSFFKPAFSLLMLIGAYPIDFSRITTAVSDSASSDPLTSLPALSRTEYWKVVVAAIVQRPFRPGRRAG